MIRIVDGDTTFEVSDAAFAMAVFLVLPQPLKAAMLRGLVERHESLCAESARREQDGEEPLTEDPIITVQISRILGGNGYGS